MNSYRKFLKLLNPVATGALLVCILLLVNCRAGYAGEREFPYKLKRSDIFLVSGAIFLNYADNLFLRNSIEPLNADQILALNRNQISRFDRPATWQWSPASGRASDKTRAVLVYAPFALLLPEIGKGEFHQALKLGAMYLEALTLCQGMNAVTKSWVGRKRPFLYNTSLGDDYRITVGSGKEAYRSFISAHTSGAFCSAVFLSKTFTDLYGRTTLSYFVWGTSLTLAGVTGYLRYNAGVHFPTDILAGALMGGAIGYLIPVMHRNNAVPGLQVTMVSPAGISLSWTF